jgi:hypothetical protein
MKGPLFKGEHMAEPLEPDSPEPDEKERSQVRGGALMTIRFVNGPSEVDRIGFSFLYSS